MPAGKFPLLLLILLGAMAIAADLNSEVSLIRKFLS